MAANGKPRLAVIKLASCDGCQLQLLDLERDLLEIAAEMEICFFPEAASRMVDGPWDIALVEGSVTTEHDLQRVREVRRQAQTLITMGACANAGGIQALRNLADVEEYTRAVYANPSYVHVLAQSTPVASHVGVDLSLSGCPVSRQQLLEVLASLLMGRTPDLPRHAVCVDCKRRGLVCALVAKSAPCLGPITQAGCGALCPGLGRGCYGCYGPMESANPDSLCRTLLAHGVPRADILHLLNAFTGWAEEFRSAAEKLERGTG